MLAVKVLPLAMVSVAPVVGAVSVTLLMVVAVATPRTGVTKVGEVEKTRVPVPVSSLIAEETERESPVEESTLLASLKTNLEAVRAELVMPPVKVEAPLTERAPVTL